MTAHFPVLAQTLKKKVAVLTWFYEPKPSLLVKRCGHASAFYMWEKCQPLNRANSVIIKNAIILNIMHNIYVIFVAQK
jgi:hypothetical protein